MECGESNMQDRRSQHHLVQCVSTEKGYYPPVELQEVQTVRAHPLEGPVDGGGGH